MTPTPPDHDFFATRRGEVFGVVDDRLTDGGLDLTLTEVDDPTIIEGDGQRFASWSVLFVGPATPLLQQGSWRLQQSGDTVELFLVPVGPPAGQPDQMRYEAAFSRTVATP